MTLHDKLIFIPLYFNFQKYFSNPHHLCKDLFVYMCRMNFTLTMRLDTPCSCLTCHWKHVAWVIYCIILCCKGAYSDPTSHSLVNLTVRPVKWYHYIKIPYLNHKSNNATNSLYYLYICTQIILHLWTFKLEECTTT